MLRFTDRAFTIATSTNPLVQFARTRIAPALIPRILKPKTTRRLAFRTMSQLAIRYRGSPRSVNGPHVPRRGPKAGDRLPDAALRHNGQGTTLHRVTARPGWHLLLCGPSPGWPETAMARVADPHHGLITVHHLSLADTSGVLYDRDGHAHRRLGLAAGDTAVCLIRPDGHIGYRAGGPDLPGLSTYLRRWLPTAASDSRASWDTG